MFGWMKKRKKQPVVRTGSVLKVQGGTYSTPDDNLLSPINPLGPFGPVVDAANIWGTHTSHVPIPAPEPPT